MILAEMSNSWTIELEDTTSRIQAGPPVEGWGQQPIYKTFDPKLVLSKTNTGKSMEQRLKECLASDWLILRPIPWVGTTPLMILMMLCCACRQELSMAAL